MGWMSHHHLYPGYPYFYCAFYLPPQVDFLQVGEKEGWQFPPFLFFFFFAKPSVERAIKGIAAADPRYIMAVRGEKCFCGIPRCCSGFFMPLSFPGKKRKGAFGAFFVFFSQRKNRFIPPGEGITTFPNYSYEKKRHVQLKTSLPNVPPTVQ